MACIEPRASARSPGLILGIGGPFQLGCSAPRLGLKFHASFRRISQRSAGTAGLASFFWVARCQALVTGRFILPGSSSGNSVRGSGQPGSFRKNWTRLKVHSGWLERACPKGGRALVNSFLFITLSSSAQVRWRTDFVSQNTQAQRLVQAGFVFSPRFYSQVGPSRWSSTPSGIVANLIAFCILSSSAQRRAGLHQPR